MLTFLQVDSSQEVPKKRWYFLNNFLHINLASLRIFSGIHCPIILWIRPLIERHFQSNPKKIPSICLKGYATRKFVSQETVSHVFAVRFFSNRMMLIAVEIDVIGSVISSLYNRHSSYVELFLNVQNKRLTSSF